MVTPREKARQKKAYQQLFNESFKRLKRGGVSADQAGPIARDVAERSLKRLETPDYRTEQEFADAVNLVCSKLSEGLSYYALIAQMPYLATARVDRIVGVARRTDPPVDPRTAAAARRAIRVEKLSGSIALLFAGLALGTLGLWYAIGVGFIIAILGEIYAQAYLPATARKTIADMWAPPVVIAAGVVVAFYLGYRWFLDTHPRNLLILLAVLALLVIAFVVPGLTLARLVELRERKLRKELEDHLLAQ
jgi:hypothetical protein